MHTEVPRVLLADDNVDILALLAARLSRRGYDIKTVTDGDAALAEIRSSPPQVAVLDCVMPGMSGPEVCAAAKADEATASTRIILLSARAGENDVRDGLAQGADRYLTKPFDFEDVAEAIGSLVNP